MECCSIYKNYQKLSWNTHEMMQNRRKWVKNAAALIMPRLERPIHLIRAKDIVSWPSSVEINGRKVPWTLQSSSRQDVVDDRIRNCQRWEKIILYGRPLKFLSIKSWWNISQSCTKVNGIWFTLAFRTRGAIKSLYESWSGEGAMKNLRDPDGLPLSRHSSNNLLSLNAPPSAKAPTSEG